MSTVSEKALSLLMPKGDIAWRGMENGSQRELLNGIAVQLERDRQNGKGIVTDFFPATTTMQKEWEQVFKLPSGELLTTAQRTARLNAVWSKIAPASFDGMNELYALSGLDVIARPLSEDEDPRVVAETSAEGSSGFVEQFTYNTNFGLNNRFGNNSIYGKFSYELVPAPSIVYNSVYGVTEYAETESMVEVFQYDTKIGLNNKYGVNAIYGKFSYVEELQPDILSSAVYGDAIYGDSTIAESGYLPNILGDGRPGESSKNYISKFGTMKYGGYTNAGRYGNFEGFKIEEPKLTIPDDEWTWPLIYIIEGPDGGFAQIPIELKPAFQFLTYKNKPNFMWAISRVQYI